MGFDVASNYLASFRQVGPVAGFENVKSDVATQAFLEAPFRNQTAGMQLANTALGTIGRMQELQFQNDLDRKQRQRLAGLALLSAPSNLISLLGSGIGGGSANARARGVVDDNFNQQQTTARQAATARSTSMGQALLQLFGNA